MFKFIAKKVTQNINEILQSLKIDSYSEEEVISTIGFEPICREKTDNNVILIYNFIENKKNNILCFIFSRNNNGFFILSKIKRKNINEIQIKKYIDILKLNLEILLEKSEIKAAELQSKPTNIDYVDNKKIYTVKSFGSKFLTNEDLDSIKYINENILKNSKTKREILKLIDLFYGMHLIVNNTDQLLNLENQVQKDFFKTYGISKNKEEFITKNAMMVIHGVNLFYIQQKKMLQNQFAVNPISKFFHHYKQKDLNNQNNYYISSYTIYNNPDHSQYFRDIQQNNMEIEIFNIILHNPQIEKKIMLSANRYVIFHSLERIYKSDIINEIAIISLDSTHSDYVYSICDSKLINKNILTDLKKINGSEVNIKYISRNTQNSEEINILNAIDHSRGKYITDQENKIIILLLLDTYEKNFKLKKENSKEDSLAIKILLQLFLKKISLNF